MSGSGAEFQFAHILTREAAYSALLERNRRALHSAAADALAADLPPGSPLEWERLPALAGHLEQAGRFMDALRHRCASLRLMAEFGRYTGWEEGLRATERCLSLAAPQGAQAAEAQQLVQQALAARDYAEGRFKAAIEKLDTLLAVPRAEAKSSSTGEIHLALGTARMRLGDLPAAQRDFDEALRHFGGPECIALACQAHRVLSVLHRDSGREEQAQTHCRLALELAQACGSPRLESLVRVAAGNEAKMFRCFSEAGEHLSQAIALARAGGDFDTEGAGLAGVAEVRLARGEAETALQEAQEALKLAQLTGNPRSEAFALNVICGAQTYLSKLDEARISIAESVRISEAASYTWGVALAANYYAQLERSCGDLKAAARWFRVGAERCRQVGHLLLAGSVLAGAAEEPLARGELAAARQLVCGDGRRWLSLGAYWTYLPRLIYARLLAAEGQYAACRAELEATSEGCAEYHAWPQSVPQIEIDRTRKALAAECGDAV